MGRARSVITDVETLLGASVLSVVPLGGGDICTSSRVRLAGDRTVFVKTLADAPPGFFSTEADGLTWLGGAGGAAVPAVLGVAAECLVLDWVEPGPPSAPAAEVLGRGLAAMHTAGAPAFGAAADGFVATLALPNQPTATWNEFWVQRRILPYLQLARDRGAVSADDVAGIEAVVNTLDSLAGPLEPPSRIHGDLWSGNVIWAAHGPPALVDPAAHGGHRETDLAMLALFGAPQLHRILGAYNDVAPLAEGWRQRVPLHQLHPLLVHAACFGGSYGHRAAAAARSLISG